MQFITVKSLAIIEESLINLNIFLIVKKKYKSIICQKNMIF